MAAVSSQPRPAGHLYNTWLTLVHCTSQHCCNCHTLCALRAVGYGTACRDIKAILTTRAGRDRLLSQLIQSCSGVALTPQFTKQEPSGN